MITAICAIIKNEHRYLKEWIDYNLGIGFSHIYLFEDYGSKTHQEIVQEYADVTLQTLADIGIAPERFNDGKKCKRQESLYDWAITNYKGKCDWLALIDIDEYIDFDEGYNLERLCNEFNDKSGLYLYWKMMTADGNVEYEDKPLRERFTEIGECLPTDRAWCDKSFVNLNVNTEPMRTIHECDGLYNTLGFQTGRIYCTEKAHIKHYFTKSWEEWCWRFRRGDLVWGHRKIDEFFVINPTMAPRREELIDWYNAKRFRENTACVKNGTFETGCDLPSFDTGKKRLLFIGNKGTKVNADGYDLVVRYNKIDGYDDIPRTDVYMLYGIPSHFVGNISRERLAKIHDLPVIYVNKQWYDFHSKDDAENTAIMLPDDVRNKARMWSDQEVIDGLGVRYTTDDMEHFQSAIRTLLFLLWAYGDEYSITIADIDRDRSYITVNPFHDRWEEEERLLDYLLYNDKIRLYDTDTYPSEERECKVPEKEL